MCRKYDESRVRLYDGVQITFFELMAPKKVTLNLIFHLFL